MGTSERSVQRAKAVKAKDPAAHEAAKKGERPRKTPVAKAKPVAADVLNQDRDEAIAENLQRSQLAAPVEDVVKVDWLRDAPLPEVAEWLLRELGVDRLGDLWDAMSADCRRHARSEG
jgi:hypothetical protein